MENRKIADRLAALRAAMEREQIDFYMIPTADFHNSEYVSDYFKVREYFCNFSGSNGTLLVWREGAGLWTDGRYFIQAEKELAGTNVTLFRMGEEGVPTLADFLKEHMERGQTLGFDGRVVPASQGLMLEKKLSPKEIRFCYEKDLAEDIWRERPAFPAGNVRVLAGELAGKSAAEKLLEVRERLAACEADALLLTKLDDIMWLFNIRGCDVECNPVAMSYAYLTMERAVLFLGKDGQGAAALEGAFPDSVEVRDYGELIPCLKALPAGQRVLVDKRYCSYMLYRLLREKQELLEGTNPTEALKAVKNPVELSHMRDIFLKDSVAVTRFIFWLKHHIGKTEITELSAADKLEWFRRQIPEFQGLSFPTIAGYGANAAMMHYEATKEQHAVLAPEGMLLVDSGGQYLGGTTDVTRTIVLGPVSEEMKKHYTLAMAGMLELTHARWLYGCTGRNLDILARQPLWNEGLDYKCGTGHGVGYFLNVHEGPQNIRWRFSEGSQEAVIEAGMDVTNEPGVYVEGSHGIRIENVMAAQNEEKNEYGRFMSFETLTWVPLDPAAVDERYLTERQKLYYREYQQKVYEKTACFLNEDERQWLLRETGAREVPPSESER